MWGFKGQRGGGGGGGADGSGPGFRLSHFDIFSPGGLFRVSGPGEDKAG